MVKLEQAVIARLEAHGEKFEILVDPDLALKVRKGETVNYNELLAIDRVFKDAKKGEEVSEEALQKVFGTTEIEPVAKKIILEGEVQLTTEQRRKMVVKRRKEVIDFIARNAFNPQTNAPHPPQRIETALEELKVHIDAMKPAREQAGPIIKEMKKMLPISMEKISLAFKIPAQYSGKASAVLHRYGVKKEDWLSDGSLVAVVDIAAGAKQELIAELNHITHGDMQSKIMEKKM
jgi:ribosome maturation protein SDO1